NERSYGERTQAWESGPRGRYGGRSRKNTDYGRCDWPIYNGNYGQNSGPWNGRNQNVYQNESGNRNPNNGRGGYQQNWNRNGPPSGRFQQLQGNYGLPQGGFNNAPQQPRSFLNAALNNQQGPQQT